MPLTSRNRDHPRHDENFLYVFKGAPLRGPPAADRPSGRACGLSGPVPARTGRPPHPHGTPTKPGRAIGRPAVSTLRRTRHHEKNQGKTTVEAVTIAVGGCAPHWFRRSPAAPYSVPRAVNGPAVRIEVATEPQCSCWSQGRCRKPTTDPRASPRLTATLTATGAGIGMQPQPQRATPARILSPSHYWSPYACLHASLWASSNGICG
jgi:hypothetical protein